MLLVDDHQGILDRASATIADDFDVVGVATGGRQALDMASQVGPDLIVLDINMPGFDGFQTKRALDHAGSRAPVVFLSAVDANDHVSAAFECGGRGYVLKPYLSRDLASALDQVLLGRLFVPSLASLFELAHGSAHAMQLYDGTDGLVDGLATFFDLALQRGDATCVIATEETREGLGRRLQGAGWDVGGPSGHPRYQAIDVAEALSQIMRNGLPDAALLAELVSGLDQYRRDAGQGASSRLTIFGNMVMPLIASGNVTAAMALERQWNQLTHNLPFLTLCGYSAACFHDRGPDLWSTACEEHWAVSHASDL